jgi:hypothetical protein
MKDLEQKKASDIVAVEASVKNTKANIAKRFEAYDITALKFAEECKQIKITDDATLAMAEQKMSKAHDIKKQIEELHKTTKAPFWEIGKFIDDVKNKSIAIIDQAINHGKEQKIAYAQIKEKEKQEELRKIQEEHNRITSLKNKIMSYENEAILAINACNTNEALTECSGSYLGKFPADSEWGEFVSEAREMAKRILEVGKARREFIRQQEELKNSSDALAIEKAKALEIEAANKAKEAELQLAQRKAEEAAEAERLKIEADAAMKEVEAQKIKGLSSTMKFEVIDFKLVPDEFKVVDEKLVREWIKSNKSGIKDGDVHFGIRFYSETGARVS